MSIEIRAPYNVFFDTDGTPLEDGYIFIGVDGLNPLSNPRPVFWDRALTIPATNIRTKFGVPSFNGAVGQLFTAISYSILVQDKHGKTIFSQPSVQFEFSHLLLTQQGGVLNRSALPPPSFNINSIIDSGLYSWTNSATVNQPPQCAAANLFLLEVISANIGGLLVIQRIHDLTQNPVGQSDQVFNFWRQSINGGAAWTPWRIGSMTVETLINNRTYTAAELFHPRTVICNNTGNITIDIQAGAALNGVELVFLQVNTGTTTINFASARAVILRNGEVARAVWHTSGWIFDKQSHGMITFGPASSGTFDWRVPAGIRTIRLSGVGGGGNGNAGDVGGGGGGGGAGASTNRLELAVLDGVLITVTLNGAGATTVVGGGHNVSYGRGSNSSGFPGGAGGVGSGGANNGGNGGNGGSGNTQGGGGGGAGGNGGNGSINNGGGGGGGGGSGSGIHPGISAINQLLSGAGSTRGGGAGGAGGFNSPGINGGNGGGGGGGGSSAANAGGAGGLPCIMIEW